MRKLLVTGSAVYSQEQKRQISNMNPTKPLGVNGVGGIYVYP